MIKVVLFVPLAEEFDGIVAFLAERGLKPPTSPKKTKRHMNTTLKIAGGGTIRLLVYVMDPENRQAMGNIVAAARVLSVVADQLPHLMILTGIAGSISSDLAKLGDVVVSISGKYLQPDKLIAFDPAVHELVPNSYAQTGSVAKGKIAIHQAKMIGDKCVLRIRRDHIVLNGSQNIYGNYEDKVAKSRPPELESARGILQPLVSDKDLQYLTHPSPAILFGDILGSEWVVDSKEFKKFVIDRNSDKDWVWDWYTQSDALSGEQEGKTRNRWETDDPILAVDMETYGFLKAAHSFAEWTGNDSKVPIPRCAALAVRGICDMSEGKGPFQRLSNGAVRKIAVKNAVTVAMDIIATHYDVVAW